MEDLAIWAEGKFEDMKEERRLVAVHASWLMNMWRKKGSPAITAARLLGESPAQSFREQMRGKKKKRESLITEKNKTR